MPKAFCKSFSISTWLLRRTLQTKFQMTLLVVAWVPIVYTHKHMNKFLLIYMKEGKVQESNFYHDCCCNVPPMASTHPHQFDYYCYVLLESLNIIIVVEICWKLNSHQLVVALRRNCPWSPTYKMSSRKNGKASVVNGTGALTMDWKNNCTEELNSIAMKSSRHETLQPPLQAKANLRTKLTCCKHTDMECWRELTEQMTMGSTRKAHFVSEEGEAQTTTS
jgi:hypothetical protein